MNHGISNRRRALGWTQKELADHARVAQSLVSDAERGNRANPDKVRQIMETLDKAEAKIARVSSEKHEQDTDRSATTAVDMSHLTLVPQSPASAVPPVAAPRPLETPVDRALSLAFDGRKHSVADLYGVHPIAARLPLGDTPEADLVPAKRI